MSITPHLESIRVAKTVKESMNNGLTLFEALARAAKEADERAARLAKRLLSKPSGDVNG